MKEKYKGQEGISGVDIVVSIGVIMIFTAIITAVYTNLIKSNLNIQRTQIATNYAVTILENADRLYYKEVTPENLLDGIEISQNYKVTVDVIPQENTGNSIKLVKVEVAYKTDKNKVLIKMEKLKQKEILITPNKPELATGMTPVKYVESELKATTEKDSTWYDYSSKKWALAIMNNNQNEIYTWIPKFAYNRLDGGSIDVKFIYGNKIRYVDNNGDLETLESGYIIPDDFEEEGQTSGIWVLTSEINLTEASRILNDSEKYGIPINI